MQPVYLSNSETFERGIPHEYFAWLREHEPVRWQPPGPSPAIVMATDPKLAKPARAYVAIVTDLGLSALGPSDRSTS